MNSMDPSSRASGVRLLHDDDRDRYVALDGDEVVGVLYYGDEPSEEPTVRDLRSTVVAPERNGEGIGSTLVRFALDDVRRRGLMARPTCWFVRGWIQRHRVYADLLAEPSRERTQADPDDERNETL